MSTQKSPSTVLSVFWCGFFSFFAAAVTLFSLTAPENPLGAPGWLREFVMPAFIVLITIILLSLSVRGEDDTLGPIFGMTLVFALVAAPCFLAVLAAIVHLSSVWFFVSLLLWLAIGLIDVYRPDAEAWPQFLTWLGAATSIASTLCLIGRYAPIAFADQPLQDAHALSVLLDIRLTLGIAFVALCLLTATVRAFRLDLVPIPTVPVPKVRLIDARHTILAPLINPLIIVFNGGLFITIQTLNVLIGLMLSLVLRVLHTGAELSKLLWQLAFRNNAVVDLLKTLLAMAVTFGVIVSALELAPRVVGYLRYGGRVSNAELPAVGALALIVLIGASIITLLLDGRGTELPRILFGASLLSVLLILSGGVVYVVGVMGLIPLPGFETIGPITIAAAALILLGVTAATIMGIAEQRNVAGAPQTPP